MLGTFFSHSNEEIKSGDKIRENWESRMGEFQEGGFK